MSTRRDRADPHDWNALDTCLHIHDSYMQQFIDSGFVVEDDVTSEWLGTPPRLLILRGRIRCQHGLFLDVLKELEVESRHGKLYVRTEQYNYHAGVEGEQNRTVFRYDNVHPHAGHADAHHKHCYDHTTWEEIRPPEWVGRDNWRHLSDVIAELQAWWDETGQHLGLEVVEQHQQT